MINIGVIGCGYWGPNLIRNFNELSDSNLLAICDLDESKLDKIVSKFNIERSKNSRFKI